MQKFVLTRVLILFYSKENEEINESLLWNLMQFKIGNEMKYFFYDPLKVAEVVNNL